MTADPKIHLQVRGDWCGVADTTMYYVYVLKSLKDGKGYIGSTTDLRRRIVEHAEGEVKSTKPRRPLELVYYEALRTKWTLDYGRQA